MITYLAWRHPKGMWSLSLANFFYKILTLGVYSFWGRTEVRRRIWSSIRLNGEPMVYTGTGWELFLGFVIIAFAILLPTTLLGVFVFFQFGPNSPVTQGFQAILYFGAFFLYGIAVYRAQRYRLSRTNWRGIRGTLQGSSLWYAFTHLWTLVLVPFTLGWIVPWRSTMLQGMITSNTHFGDRPFRFSATSSPLYGPFAVMWFGIFGLFVLGFLVFIAIWAYLRTIFGDLSVQSEATALGRGILGATMLAIALAGYLLYLLISAWYRARVINHFANATSFEGASFSGALRGRGLLWVDVTNALILFIGPLLMLIALSAVFAAVLMYFGLSLGPSGGGREAAMVFGRYFAPVAIVVFAFSFSLLLPVTQARSTRYLVEHLRFQGLVPVEDIKQSSERMTATGEGLASAFDVDAL